MSAPVLADDGSGRALIFDRVTGEVMRVSVPTAIENVANSGGRFVHGETGEPMKAEQAAKVVEAAIPLTDPDVLPLPAADQAPAPAAAEDAAPKLDPLDHGGDGKKGWARKPADPERAAVIAALKASKIKFFAGSSTEKLKTLLPG